MNPPQHIYCYKFMDAPVSFTVHQDILAESSMMHPETPVLSILLLTVTARGFILRRARRRLRVLVKD